MWLKAEIRARPKCSIKGPCAHLEMWQINKSTGNQERVVMDSSFKNPLKYVWQWQIQVKIVNEKLYSHAQSNTTDFSN